MQQAVNRLTELQAKAAKSPEQAFDDLQERYQAYCGDVPIGSTAEAFDVWKWRFLSQHVADEMHAVNAAFGKRAHRAAPY
eukprot:14841230-Alexandrium_andersonii.AAC.1